jgi:hypothetical protein
VNVPSQLNITLTTSGNPTVNMSISASLQSLNATQTGYSSVDVAIANIFKRGYFLATNGVIYAASVIQSISWQ